MVRPSFFQVPSLKNWFTDTCNHNVDYLCGALEREVPQRESLSLLCRPGSSAPFYFRDNPGITFSNVKHLALYFPIVRYELLSITLPILKACPSPVKFQFMLMRHPVDEMSFTPSELVEEPRLTALKEVEFGGFHGSKNQVKLVTYLIENAVSLERLVLSTGHRCCRGFGKFTHGC